MKITVIGCGRWGTFIAWYLDKIGHSVSLYGRKSSAHMQKLIETRTNGLVELPETLHLTNSLDTVKDSDVIVISVNSQGLRGLMRELQPFELKNKIFVLCMKGVEIETGMRLSQVCAAECDSSNAVAVWVGPGHVQEFAAGVPNCMVIDSDSEDAKKTLVESFGSDLIRFYYGQDLIGNEIGAAAKNVVGIAAGMLDGLGLSTLKGALMARGTREIARLIDALGGNRAFGLRALSPRRLRSDAVFAVFAQPHVRREVCEKRAVHRFAGWAITPWTRFCALARRFQPIYRFAARYTMCCIKAKMHTMKSTLCLQGV